MTTLHGKPSGGNGWQPPTRTRVSDPSSHLSGKRLPDRHYFADDCAEALSIVREPLADPGQYLIRDVVTRLAAFRAIPEHAPKPVRIALQSPAQGLDSMLSHAGGRASSTLATGDGRHRDNLSQTVLDDLGGRRSGAYGAFALVSGTTICSSKSWLCAVSHVGIRSPLAAVRAAVRAR